MAVQTDNPSMAVFCDFENVALGVRDAKYDKFDIKRVLERLLLKGSIVVKKAYCDWERYKAFKATMHEASFELIEIPHVRQSGKNSADIRLVVDALDLCYTKAHVDTFVIISGDSDFSPLVSKLRENAKQVIGVGVKQSTSDLLIANCDEFIFYDDLVREGQRSAATAPRRGAAEAPAAAGRRPAEGDNSQEASRRKEEGREDPEARRRRALDMALETFEALLAERGASGRIWASVLKDAIKRRKPDFNEARYGFRTFGSLLDEAQLRGLLEVGRDEKSNTYVRRAAGGVVAPPAPAAPVASVAAPPVLAPRPAAAALPEAPAASEPGRPARGTRRTAGRRASKEASDNVAVEAEIAKAEPGGTLAPAATPVAAAPALTAPAAKKTARKTARTTARKTSPESAADNARNTPEDAASKAADKPVSRKKR